MEGAQKMNAILEFLKNNPRAAILLGLIIIYIRARIRFKLEDQRDFKNDSSFKPDIRPIFNNTAPAKKSTNYPLVFLILFVTVMIIIYFNKNKQDTHPTPSPAISRENTTEKLKLPIDDLFSVKPVYTKPIEKSKPYLQTPGNWKGFMKEFKQAVNDQDWSIVYNLTHPGSSLYSLSGEEITIKSSEDMEVLFIAFWGYIQANMNTSTYYPEYEIKGHNYPAFILQYSKNNYYALFYYDPAHNGWGFGGSIRR